MLTPLANLETTGPAFGVAAVVLLAWMPIAIAIVRLVGRPGRGLIAAAIVGWLFLPQTAINTPFVLFDKSVALEVGLLLAMLISHPPALRPRLRWVDAPMILWCLVPGLAAVSNNLSFYDTAAAVTKQALDWGTPYLLGRIYLTHWSDARDLALGIFMGGLAYVPLCLAESVYSPFLHHAVYGVYQHASGILQAQRDGGWRPMVFMQHGLAVGLYMVAASLMGWWLWWTGSLRKVFFVPVILPLLVLLATTVEVKSLGALVLFPVGLAALHFTRVIGRRVVLAALILIPGAYVTARVATPWNGDNAIAYAHRAFGADRAESLAYRLYNERAYLDHDRAKPLLGYGPGPSFLVSEGEDAVVVDSLWIIIVSVDGAIGIVALLLCFAAPITALLWRIPVRHYAHPAFAGAVGLAVLLLLYGLDNLVNAMFNPVFMVALGCVGALSGAAITQGPTARRRRKLFSRRPRATPPPVNAPLQPRVESLEHVLAADTISLEVD